MPNVPLAANPRFQDAKQTRPLPLLVDTDSGIRNTAKYVP